MRVHFWIGIVLDTNYKYTELNNKDLAPLSLFLRLERLVLLDVGEELSERRLK